MDTVRENNLDLITSALGTQGYVRIVGSADGKSYRMAIQDFMDLVAENPAVAELVTEEAEARQAADNEITLTVTNLQGALASEISARQAADTTLQGAISSETTTRAAADTALSGEVSDLKADFDEKVDSRFGNEYSPNLIESDESMTMGYVAKNGSIASGSTMAYTDYITVSPGDVLRAYYTKDNVFLQKALRFVCCYDQSKTPVSSAGTNTSVSTFTIPEDIAFVRVTVDGVTEAVNNYMLSVNYTPTEYTAYTPLKVDITEDFLTQESETFLTGLIENGIDSKNIQNKYGCALPQTKIFQTIGLPEKWYIDSMVTPPNTNIRANAGTAYVARANDGILFKNDTAVTAVNGYSWYWYDMFYALIKSSTGNSGAGWGRRFISENLLDCSLLAIGDSTVDHDTLTATLLSHFTAQGHTLTLLGTLGDGSETNKNEGRAGWKAQDYLTDRQYQGVTNPFYNPTAQTFDFAYYMSNQGYTGVDFVVLQLGINDLYNYDDTYIVPTWNAVSAIIDSILAYNSGIKIILNLPTTPNSDQAELNVAEFLYRNRVVRYNEYAMAQSLAKYGTSKVRCSYCHLILDSHTEIRDNVHPTVAGYQKMALEVVNQINAWQNEA